VNTEIDFSGKNLQGKSFKGTDLQCTNFSGSDLRGADFSGAKLSGADFSNAVTGMKISSKILIFIFALLFSLCSGYIAMLAGSTTQGMIKSADSHERISGYITIAFLVIFTGFASWKGIFKAIRNVLPFLIAIPIVLGLFMLLSGLGTGKGAYYGFLVMLLMTLMFVVGTISRVTAGTLASNILFLIVAIGGGFFGRSVGGGLGTIVMAISCAYISKHALKAENPTSMLWKIALSIGTYFGTSFKNADLTQAIFRDASVRNTNFSGANLTEVDWTNAKKQYILTDNEK